MVTVYAISNSKATKASVLRDRRVDLVRPVQNSTLQVLHPGKSLLPQEAGRLRAPSAHLALDDDFLVARNLSHALRHLAQRNQRRAWNPADLILVRLAHIEQEEIFLRVDLPLELDY